MLYMYLTSVKENDIIQTEEIFDARQIERRFPVEDLILQKQDLTYLKWAHTRSSSGTAGTFLKSESMLGGRKKYYKLSRYDAVNGIVGHECVNELIADRLLQVLGVEHIRYQLIQADVDVDGRIFDTYLCASEDFKEPGESKWALDAYYEANALPGEPPYAFCERNGWREYLDTMLAVDYLLLNRDRHGANIEVLRNARARTIRLAPLFDHGLTLLCTCETETEAEQFDVLADRPCQNFIGGRSCYENLALIADKKSVFQKPLRIEDKEFIFRGLEGVLPEIFLEKIWKMIYSRYKIYEKL